MGNREDLLAGAKRCLRDKGYARTTVRDIAAAAGGVSMAAIGYHYGSREALLNQALFELLDEWGAEIRGALAGALKPGASPAERFEATWSRMIRSFTEQRPLWLASFEATTQGDQSPQLRRQLNAGQEEGRRGMASWVLGVDEERVTDEEARTVGAVQTALVSGIMIQWLFDPDSAPSAAEVLAGLRAIAAGLDDTGGDERTATGSATGTS